MNCVNMPNWFHWRTEFTQQQRHNNSSQLHNLIKRINWCINAMYLTNINIFRWKDGILLKAHIHGAQMCLTGYIHTNGVPTLHNRGVLIRSNLLTQNRKGYPRKWSRGGNTLGGVPWWIMTSHLDTSACQAAQPYVACHRRPSVLS
jgi:hypothetical protein